MNAKLALAAMIMAGALAGCSSKPTGPRVDVTIGQQLIELKEAHASGALTDKEYDRQRKRLIESVN